MFSFQITDLNGFFNFEYDPQSPERNLIIATILRAYNDRAHYVPSHYRKSAICWFANYDRLQSSTAILSFRYCADVLELSDPTIKFLMDKAHDAARKCKETESKLKTEGKSYREICCRLVKGARIRVSKT